MTLERKGRFKDNAPMLSPLEEAKRKLEDVWRRNERGIIDDDVRLHELDCLLTSYEENVPDLYCTLTDKNDHGKSIVTQIRDRFNRRR